MAAACGDSDEERGLVLMTHDSFLVSEGVFEEFTADTFRDIYGEDAEPVAGLVAEA